MSYKICRLFIMVLAGMLCIAGAKLRAQQNEQVQQAMQKLQEAQKILDSVKKKIPSLGNIKLPNGYNMPTDSTVKAGLPDFNKMATQLQQNANTLQALQQQGQQQRDANLPHNNGAVNITTLAKFGENDVVTIAKALLPSVTKSLDSIGGFMRQKLDQSINDTGVNVAGTGMALYEADVTQYPGEYLICKGVILNPGNLWGINDLGIVLRNRKMYKQAIQCFLYACSFSDSLYIIKANLAWATAYYGDFENAKKYFNQVLAVNPGFSGAEEGLALIAYQEGNIQALFDCLAKEIKGFGAGGPGPSDAFANVCGGVQMDAGIANMGNKPQGGNTAANTFDNDNGDEGNQDPPPTAETEPITYPSMGGMFANGVDDGMRVLSGTPSFLNQVKTAIEQSAGKVAAAQAGLSRLAQAPYIDDRGDRVIPYSYQKFYTLFHLVHEEFEKRASQLYKEYDDKMSPLITSITKNDAAMVKDYNAALAACTDNACRNGVRCDWRTKFRSAKGADLTGISSLWTEYYKKLIDNINWYVSASSPFIKRMHKADWNTYMNAIRLDDAHHAALVMFNKWITTQGVTFGVTSGIIEDLKTQDCFTPLREIEATGPDPKDVKLKKLQTYPEYCDDKVSSESFELPGLSYSSNCSQMTIQVGSDDAGAFYQRNYSKQAQEKNNTRIGVSLGFGYEESIKAGGAGNSSASIKASLKAKVQAGYQYNDDGTMAKFANAEISAGISGKVTTGDENADKLLQTASFNHGFTIKTEVMAYKGADGNYGNWNMTQLSGTKH